MQSRRKFIQNSFLGSAVFFVPKGIQNLQYAEDFEVQEKTVLELQKAMKDKKITAVKLVDIYLARIKEIDPLIHSMIEINPEAKEIAKVLDKERAQGHIRSNLHGIPVVIKDNIDTADKMKTTAGSLALADAPTPAKDAHLVKQLREAGAVLLGKTNLSEWANFRSTNSSSGWSGRGGQTRNPYILDRSPCGSSSGSGAAIAANLASIAIGTETDGSIVCPSSINGIVGIKPTLGLVSRAGVIPIAHSQDTAGPMARTVTDAVITLSAICGVDQDDPITSAFATKGHKDYTQFLNPNGLEGARLGVVRQYFNKNVRVDQLMNQCLARMEEKGAIIVDVHFPELKNHGDDEFEVLLTEFKADLNKYLETRGGKLNSLSKIIEFNKKNPDKEMPYFQQEIFESAAGKKDLNNKIYQLALLRSKVLTQDRGIDMVMQKHNLDAIVAPSNAPSWMIDLINGDSPTNYISSSSLPAVSGYPNITVPAGFIDEMPIGISFFGKAFSEPTLIAVAYAWEQMSNARRKPKYLKTFQRD